MSKLLIISPHHAEQVKRERAERKAAKSSKDNDDDENSAKVELRTCTPARPVLRHFLFSLSLSLSLSLYSLYD